jgi:MATE family multidrug resistance protein
MRTALDESASESAGTLGELVRVALPLVVSYASTALMYMVDRVFLSWDSVEALAASLPAAVLHYNLAALGIGTAAYATAFVGQYEGAGQHHRVGPVLWQGVYISLAAAALMLASLPFAPAAFRWFDHGAAIAPLELSYYRIMCAGSLPLFLGTTLSCFYSGRGRTNVVMVVNMIATAINIGLDYVMIFGKFGFPRMGIQGAALATTIGFASIPVMYVLHMAATERRGPYRLWAGRRFDGELFRRLLRFGLPSGCQQFLDVACFTIFIQIVGRLGIEQLSATGLVFNLNSLTFIPLLGLGTAVTALVGHRIGEGRPRLAARTTWLAAGLATAYVSVFCLVYVLAPEAILRPYGLAERDTLRELVVFLLKLVALYSWFDAMVVVFSSAIRGAGDTRFALVFSVSMGVLVLVLPTYVASHYGTAGFIVAWYAVVAYLMVCAAGFFARFQQGRWMSMRVIEHTLPELEAEAGEGAETAAVAVLES